MRGRTFAWAFAVFLAGTVLIGGLSVMEYVSCPPGHLFTGFDSGGPDYFTYLAKMRAGLEGCWAYADRMTPEETEPVAIYLPYLALGHLARISGLGLPVTYHAARALFGGAALAAVWILMRVALGPGRGDLAALLGAFASGFGLAGPLADTPAVRAELSPQSHVYLGLLFAPHYSLSLIGFLSVLLGWFLFREGKRKTAWVLCVLGCALLSLNHPFLVPLAALVPAAHSAISGRRMREGTAGVLYALPGVLISIPYLALLLYRFVTVPWLAEWRSQVEPWVPAPHLLLLGYGAVGLLALWGAAGLRRDPEGIPWALWSVFALASAYALPVGNAREFMFFLSLPLGALASGPVWRLLGKKGLALCLLVGVVLTGPAWKFVWFSYASTPPRDDALFEGMYLPPGTARLLREIERDPGVVLCGFEAGNALYAFTGARPVIGHPLETLDYEEKRREVRRLWSGEMTAEEAWAFLDETGVKWVLVDRLPAWHQASEPDAPRAGPVPEKYRSLLELRVCAPEGELWIRRD